MPYIIRPATEKGEKGFKVCKQDDRKRCFSKHPLPIETAKKQRTAIILSEMGRAGAKTNKSDTNRKGNQRKQGTRK